MAKAPASVLVTGAGSGLGRAIALRFGALGCRVALLGRRTEALEETRAGLPEACPDSLCLSADVRDAEAVAEAMGTLQARWRRLAVLVNNAALTAGRNPHLGPWHEFECVLKTNVLGAALVAEHAAAAMERGGVIVNISSTAARAPTPEALAYGASKAALDHLTCSLAVRYAERRVRVVGVAPGGLAGPDGDVGESRASRRVVDLVVLVASGEAAAVSGETLVADGGTLLDRLGRAF